MKLIWTILVLISAVSCEKKDNTASKSIELPKPTVSKTFDTLMAGDYILTFEPAAKFQDVDIYGDLAARLKLTDTIGNSRKRPKPSRITCRDRYRDISRRQL